MENCVGSFYMQSENDTSKPMESPTCTHTCLSNSQEQKSKCKNCCKISKVRKKIVPQEQFNGQPDGEKKGRKVSGSKLNVLNKLVTGITRQSVQKKTKIIKRNVPDRLGKYVSYSVRSETKLSLDTKSASNEYSAKGKKKSLEEYSCDGYNETKLALLGKECLNNKEAVSLSNSFESDMDRENIFENFHDDCLGSTSKGNEASSQDKREEKNESLSGSLEKEGEKTPAKKLQEVKSPPPTPVKVKDHNNYYNSHKNIRHVCAYCHKIFKSNGKLNSHVYSHTGERPFDCSHCGKAFSSKFKLVRHLLIHSEIRKFVCQICNRTFLRNDHLKNHYKVHDPQKKIYKCPKENCDKEYSSIMSHKKHMAYHNVEDGDLKCLICSVKYETKEEILFHLKSHSGSRLFKSQSDKKFKCEFCDRLFLTRKDVTRHLVVHTGERDFLCQFCPQRFGRKDHLVRHIKKSHGNEDLSAKNDFEVKIKDENNKAEEIKKPIKDSPVAVSNPQPVTPDSTTKEINTQTEDKASIVITVQGSSGSKKRAAETENRKKAFHKNDSLVPKKKQVPLTKAKGSTTQILLQNIPNILIIPNNSIIFVRNQTPKKDEEPTVAELEPLHPPPPPPPPPVNVSESLGTANFISPTNQPPADNFNLNFGYDTFQSPSNFLNSFPESDNFCNFQSDLPSFGNQFEEPEHLNFEMLNQGDTTDVDLSTPMRSESLTNGNLLSETSRQIKLLETGMSSITEKPEREKNVGCEDLFEDDMLNESLLNEFKDESSGILPPDGDVGILSNILSNQSNDNCGFELLRNLLTSENPSLSPLPGFNQIFHNSNTNSS